ncbi:hypothetical protein BGX26_006624, partial [Mortierella sp. AD094]
VGSRRESLANSLSMPSPALQGTKCHPMPSPSMPASLPLPPGFSASPRPSFRYIPVEYLTPSHSAVTTPKMSPMILPSSSSPMPSPTPYNATPPLPSPPLSYSSSNGPTIRASSKVPAAIIAAAMAISSVSPQTPNPLVKRLSSRGKVLSAEGAATDVPPFPYPPPPVIPQRIASRAYFPWPPLDPSTSTVAAS